MVGLLEVVLFFFGVASGFIAGLLGVGGAIILIPMMIYILPYFGFNLSMHEIMGLSMALVFFAALAGAITHFKGGNFNKNLVIFVGSAMFFGSLIGGIASSVVTERTLLSIFALVLAISIGLMLTSKKESDIDNANNNCDYMVSIKEKKIGLFLGFTIGILSGMIGLGGAAILTASLIFFLKIPIKVCIGTSLAIVLAGSAAGFFGKAVTNQIPFIPAIFLVAGGILAARFGSKVSMKLKSEHLKKILVVVLIITLIQITFSLF